MVTTLTAERLAELQDEDAEFVLLDTRPEESFEAWHVKGATNFPFGPEEDLDEDGQLDDLRAVVGDHDRIVAICAKGLSSGNLATQLASATDEFEVQAVEGGMKDWSGVYDHVAVDVGGPTVVQVQRRAKGCLGYVVGGETGAAVVVDPTEDTGEFEVAAAEHGLTIEAVIDTHVHADHLTGGRRLAGDLGVPYYLGEHAEERDLAYEYEPLARNEVLDVGDLDVKALHTPGHTSESLSLLVDDAALLTADTLHVDSVGRTELEFGEGDSEDASGDAANEGAERGARLLYGSLHRTLLAEPDGITILPGHVEVTSEGEFGHGSPGEPIATTVGEARTGIDLLSLDEAAFVDRMADAGEKPANYEEIIELNRGVREEPPEDRVELELGPNNCSA
ncbi:MBL fold metallo-hydrolase [Salinilacihabitans rarus]|uniref:MBL fold metallo-hydrolase n=1 Tax=Salinilacihabitans rarus TaxID=2961596 RepID=UPI0020C86BDF|nr:rhodanese-like domain-containing protein [Salinilacihabitans rarus]